MIFLIVNGDDFGLCAPVNRGIVNACLNGILTSTSLMANGAGFDEACRTSRKIPQLSVGLHLTLTRGIPLLPVRTVSTLVDRHGQFFTKWAFINRALAGSLDAGQLDAEIRAQLQAVLSAGVNVTHLDSHHHVHALPVVGRIVAGLAQEYQLPIWRTFYQTERDSSLQAKACAWLWRAGVQRGMVRQPKQPVCRFSGIDWMTSRDKIKSLFKIIGTLPEGFNELMCHPAEADITSQIPHDPLSRTAELQALCNPQIRRHLEECQIKLISFAEMKAMPLAEKIAQN